MRSSVCSIRVLVSILADTAVRAADVDEAAAEQARRDALSAIEDQNVEFDFGRASARLAEAAAQLRTLQKIRQQTRG